MRARLSPTETAASAGTTLEWDGCASPSFLERKAPASGRSARAAPKDPGRSSEAFGGGHEQAGGGGGLGRGGSPSVKSGSGGWLPAAPGVANVAKTIASVANNRALSQPLRARRVVARAIVDSDRPS